MIDVAGHARQRGGHVARVPSHGRSGGGHTRARLRKLIVPTHLTTSSDTTNKDTYDTASVTLAPGEELLIGIVQTGTTANGPANFTGSTLGVSLSLVVTSGAAASRISVYRAMVNSLVSGFVRINFAAGDVTTGCHWSLVKYAGVDPSGLNGANAVVQSIGALGSAGTTVNIPLAAALANPNNMMVYFLTQAANELITSPGPGFTKRGDVSHATPNRGLASADAIGRAAADPTWTTSSTPRWNALELKSGMA